MCDLPDLRSPSQIQVPEPPFWQFRKIISSLLTCPAYVLFTTIIVTTTPCNIYSYIYRHQTLLSVFSLLSNLIFKTTLGDRCYYYCPIVEVRKLRQAEVK